MSLLESLDLSEEQALLLLKQTSGYVAWKDLDLNMEAFNDELARACGFKDAKSSLGKQIAHANLPGRLSEMAGEFIAEDLIILRAQETIRTLACVCYVGDDWQVIYGQKSILRDSIGNPVGLALHYMDVTNYAFLQNSLALLGMDLRYQKNPKQATYIIKSTYSDLPLTPRETEIAFYLLRRKMNREIAERLNISRRTVEAHLQHIKDKLACRTKPQLIEKLLNLNCLQQIPSSLM